MSDLYPTKTRLALLQAVDDGAVTEHYPWMKPKPPYAMWDHGPGSDHRGRYQLVTARVKELYRAGWILLGEKETTEYGAPRYFELTDAGRRILDGAK